MLSRRDAQTALTPLAIVGAASVAVLIGLGLWKKWNRRTPGSCVATPERVDQFRSAPNLTARWYHSGSTAPLSACDSAYIEAFLVRNLAPERLRNLEFKSKRTFAIDGVPPFWVRFDYVEGWIEAMDASSCIISPLVRKPAFLPLDAVLPHFPTLCNRVRTIEYDSEEFRTLRLCLNDDSTCKKHQLVRVQKVENSVLMDAFEQCRHRSLKQAASRARNNVFKIFSRKIAGIKNMVSSACSSANTDKLRCDDEVQRAAFASGNTLLFHGTDLHSAASIVEHGFDPGRAGQSNGTSFGKGIYFALRPGMSAGFAIPFCSTHYVLLCCRVIAGSFSYLNSPPTPSDNFDASLHATVNTLITPTVFVVANSDQVYPLYLLYMRA